jgi:hypothetical protein
MWGTALKDTLSVQSVEHLRWQILWYNSTCKVMRYSEP